MSYVKTDDTILYHTFPSVHLEGHMNHMTCKDALKLVNFTNYNFMQVYYTLILYIYCSEVSEKTFH